MTQPSEKPSIDEAMAHYGVMGMHWGVTRAKATSSQIHTARQNVHRQSEKVMDQKRVIRLTKEGSTARAIAEKKYSSMKLAQLNNPDRVVASRLTKGEKSVAIIAGLTVITPVAPILLIAGTSAKSRRVEYKQKTGAYNKPSSLKRDPNTGVRPIAKSLDESKFGKVANANAQRYMARQNRKAANS